MVNERPALKFGSLNSGPQQIEKTAKASLELFRKLFVKEKARKIFEYGEHLPEVKQERSRLAKLAEQVLHELLFEPHRENLTYEEYLKIRETIKRFYLLATPCIDPDSHKKILEVEEMTTRKHIGRDNKLGQMVWLAQENVADENRKFTRVKASETTQSEQADVERWFKANDGLVDHTFIATEYIIALVQSIQEKLGSIQKEKLNELQKEFLKVDPYLYGIKMLFHDLGRLINQDRLQHEKETQEILGAAGVHEHFREEPAYVDLLNMDQTYSVYSVAKSEDEKGFMSLIFYLADFTAKIKANGSIRRPADFIEIIDKQTKRYTGKSDENKGGLFTNSEELFNQDDYGLLEGVWLTKILFWLRDQKEGLGFSIGQLRKVYSQVEKKIKINREELGII